MPEVPELNLVGLTLQKHFKGQRVESIEILWKKRVKASQEEFDAKIPGGKLQSVTRNGKELHLQFDNGNVLGIHMMLTGRMHLLPTDEEIKYPIFRLIFENEAGIAVADGMGQAKPILNPEIPDVPDIMSEEFSLDYLKGILAKRSKKIKELILDQKVMRGIGNAYADEILWHSKISPFSDANAIPAGKVKDLFESIKSVTKEATDGLEKLKLNDKVFEMENYDHRFIHNSSKKYAPDGYEILKGKVGTSKTYYTDNQVLYDIINRK
ncbi:Formamidopyrimidine-DNA glycosylase [Dyadobacter sp. CECT 9623]|uniref:Formamidopyrimidine-DNA glycosylase n=1 Tax=Dyadobacter linearis TaxID=2823330 RepID=A0ABM8UKE4_9BACT|nr:DNA-formamidopyrimidine glycosylase family protein [Dyadobacter sp. CECT 9623]CAG5067939.1 Formamidopyrimidine-DNA glycosylase [Dyadobacter sp. CECT 9623]